MMMVNVHKIYVWYIIHMFSWHEKPFWSTDSDFNFFFLFSTETHDRCSQFDKTSELVAPQHKRAPDLAWFSLYSLFCPLCFVSFFKFISFYLSNIYLSSNTQATGAGASVFVLAYAFYWKKNIKYKLRCASARLVAASKASSKVGKSSWPV